MEQQAIAHDTQGTHGTNKASGTHTAQGTKTAHGTNSKKFKTGPAGCLPQWQAWLLPSP